MTTSCNCDCHGAAHQVGRVCGCCAIGGKAALSVDDDGAPQLPRRQQSDPIRGWKVGDLVAAVDRHGSSMRFAGVGHGALYGVESAAECLAGNHPAGAPVPAIECTCGFWALPSPDDVDHQQMANYAPGRRWLLEVELFGTIVRHQRGYRAERQRTLVVTAPWMCLRCPNGARKAPWFSNHLDGMVVAAFCDEHALEVPPSTRVTVQQIRDAIGTEVVAPHAAPDDAEWPQRPAPPAAPEGAPDAALTLALLEQIAISQTGRMPRDVLDLLQPSTIQRWPLPGRNAAFSPYLEAMVDQSTLTLRLIHCNGQVLWQIVLRAGASLAELYGAPAP